MSGASQARFAEPACLPDSMPLGETPGDARRLIKQTDHVLHRPAGDRLRTCRCQPAVVTLTKS